ncbi:MAG: hypothetical protein P9M12_07295 [Candidatus Aceula lacicola]|nr:hypothetical protein [Candidatus Aceula lacicola]
MKKLFLTLFLISTLFICHFSYAQNLKTIELKDGSQIKGNVLSLNNGIYSVETSFGAIQVEEKNILNISSENSFPQAQSQKIGKDQMMEYQQQLLGDPQVLSGIQTIAQDPEIQAAFSDPEFAQAIMAQDLQKLQNSPKFKDLLKNPKMQKLINSAGQAIGQPVSF